MNTVSRFLLLCLGLSAPLALPATITRIVEKSFAVQPGGHLRATTQGGDIIIKTADVPEVRVIVRQTVRVATEAEADGVLAKLELTLEQQGNDVTVGAKYGERSPGSWFRSWPPVMVSFTVTVPRHYDLNLGTSGGNIVVSSLRGNIRARTSGGDLKFDRIDGEIDGGTSGGNISLQEGTARVTLTTSGGDIRVDRAGGPTEVATSGGNISLKSVAQLISASTSGGDVHAVITEPLRQDALLSTSGGNVAVVVVREAGFDLDARTSGGDVKAEGVTIALEKGGNKKNQLVGAVNGGGPRLKLRSSGGDVSVRTN